jgi:hypothetical protein
MAAALPTSLSIGGVTLVLLSDGEFRMYPDSPVTVRRTS